ncbi:MAG: cytoplasmic protein [Prolixibacteraceae bacterium]|jgi:hypothetical protein
MKLIPVQVECHSGYKADEYPVCFYWQNVKYEISEIADRWFQAAHTEAGPVANYFKVKTKGKQEFILKYEIVGDRWFLVQSDDAVFGFSLN